MRCTAYEIVSHIRRAIGYCKDATFDDFLGKRMLQEACVFNVLRIGELSKAGLDDVFVKAHPEIPWKQMYGMRNRILHDFDGIRPQVIWSTITEDSPELFNALSSIFDTL